MQKIKIIHVVHDFLFGGIESYLYYLVQAQKYNDQLEIAILCCQDENCVANPRLKSVGVKIYYLPIKPFDLNVAKYRKVMQIVSKYDFAQLHIYKPLLLEALYRSKTAVIFTVHTAGAVRREQSFYGKSKVAFQVKQLNRCCKGVVNNSNYSQQYWLEKGVKKENNAVIYNGVGFNDSFDKNFARSMFPEIIGNGFIVGTTSRFIGWKRVDFLIKGFAKFLNKYGDAKLLLVGDGTEMENLKSLVSNLGIDDSVIFTGFQKQVTSFQSVMDVCVFPSVSEPFGLVAIECMHLGKPVVVMNDGGGLRELVEQVEPDLIVDDVNAMADKLYELATKMRVGDEEVIESRISFAEQFNIFEIERKYLGYYKYLELHD